MAANELACPPLRAVLSILATGSFEGKTADDPDVRGFCLHETRCWPAIGTSLRLKEKQTRDKAHWSDCVERLKQYMSTADHQESTDELHLAERLEYATSQLGGLYRRTSIKNR